MQLERPESFKIQKGQAVFEDRDPAVLGHLQRWQHETQNSKYGCLTLRKRIALLLAVVFVITAVFTSYSIKTLNSLHATQNINESANVEKIEIIHFHVTQQCLSCILVSGYTEAAVNTYFQNEVPNGKLGMFEKWAKIIFLAVGVYYTVMVFLW